MYITFLFLIFTLFSNASTPVQLGPDGDSSLLNEQQVIELACRDSSIYQNMIRHKQTQQMLVFGNMDYTECGFDTWSDKFDTREEALKVLDQEYGLSRSKLEAAFGTPISLIYRMTDEEYAKIRGHIPLELLEKADNWRLWKYNHSCFDAKMVTLQKGEAQYDDTLPQKCVIKLEKWMYPEGSILKEETLVWTKDTSVFLSPGFHSNKQEAFSTSNNNLDTDLSNEKQDLQIKTDSPTQSYLFFWFVFFAGLVSTILVLIYLIQNARN